jgi:hypothetical protein
MPVSLVQTVEESTTAEQRRLVQQIVSRLTDSQPARYIVTVLGVLLSAAVWSLWQRSIFYCQASGYGTDGYLAYCGAAGYGDYDYGAFWFGLEPEAARAAANAQVLFVGNSRMQFAFSTPATNGWFSSLRARYYLLGFAYNGNYTFEQPLLRKLGPNAHTYVINLDSFFERAEPAPAAVVMRDQRAQGRYQQKRELQGSHQLVCEGLPTLCGDAPAFFRSRATGAWTVTGGPFTSKPVSYDEKVDPAMVQAYTSVGADFLSRLPVRRECTILTMVPTVGTELATAKAVASALGSPLIAPVLTDLITFDKSHLDSASAQRWSAEFLRAAGPQIRKCLDERAALNANASTR